jgi:hypothetical protein
VNHDADALYLTRLLTERPSDVLRPFSVSTRLIRRAAADHFRDVHEVETFRSGTSGFHPDCRIASSSHSRQRLRNASSESGCSRDQEQPCPDDDGADGSCNALTGCRRHAPN